MHELEVVGENAVCHGGGVMALAITPQGEFGYLPNCGKDSNREARPWLDSVLMAELHFPRQPEAAAEESTFLQ